MKRKLIILLVLLFIIYPQYKKVIASCPGAVVEGDYCFSLTSPYIYINYCQCKRNIIGRCYESCSTVKSSGSMCATGFPGFGCQCASMLSKSHSCNTVTCKETSTYTYVACGGSCTRVNGICGTSNGGTFASVSEITNTCSKGSTTWIDNVGSDGIFNWNCTGSCSGSTANCSANSSSPSSFSSLVLKTYDGDTVAVENGGRNQICQSIFRQDTVNKNGVQFVVTATNALGVGNIGTIQVRLRNTSNTYTFTPVASVNGVATIPVDLSASGVSNGTYNIEVLINNVGGTVNSGWIDTGRDFKYWNCQVPVTGSIYDGSDGENCPDFSSNLATYSNLTSLTFTSPTSGLSSVMTVNSSPTYSSGSNPLIWGTTGYQAIFNSDLAIMDKSLKLIDVGAGTTSVGCNSTLNFDLDENVVDPYSDIPRLQADFSGMVSQDAWFQTINGGVLSKSVITNYVPTTCGLSSNGCVEATAINGLVVAPTINAFDGVPYSSPSNWYVKASTINKVNFFEKYKNITGIGTTLIEGDLNNSDVINNTEGLILVNGNVNINQNKTTAIGNFLMIVANGDITIDESVNQFDGILVGNNINIGGSSADQLEINGSVYATNKVNIVRSFTNKGDNNDSPAVVINFRPDFIFNMPSSMAKNVIEWKWGN